MAGQTPILEDTPARRPRADAVRNRARIVETAREVFAARGSDAYFGTDTLLIAPEKPRSSAKKGPTRP